MTVLHGVQLALISAFLTAVIDASVPPEQSSLPPGYYAFETGGRRHGTPPRVRPPPYIPTDVPCPGVNHNTFMYSPRDTLCGDLNKAFIPRNPMGQHPMNQPYPFEIIKNKTLHFLARALPFLKDDMDSIPKVVKLTKRDPSLESLPPPPPASTHYDFVHSVRKKRSTTAEGSSPVMSTSSSSSTPVEERSPRGSTSSSTKSAAASLLSGLAGGVGGGGGLFGSSNWNLSEARQKACEHKDGIMCQLVNGLSGNNLLTQAVQVISAAQTAANTAQSIGSLASLLHHFSSASSSSSPSSASGEQPSKSLMSQIAAALSSDDLSPPPSSPPSSTSSSLSGSSNFNPVLAVLDYLASNSNEKSAVSSLLPARRKKPMDLEELASEAAAAVSVTNKVPPTPCPSLEEYIAPVFARNYQGVWKYIVQIPHEGYFTQTVQKTSCVKTKCDFMDGSCHESPRWVSLLVAEIFYPDARFPQPVPMPAPASRYDAPQQQVYHYHQQNTMMHQPLHQQQQVFVGPRPEVKRQPAVVPQQPRPQWRAVDPPTAPVSQMSSTPTVSQVSPAQPQPSPTTPVNSSGARRMKRQSGVSGEDDSNDVDKKPMDEKECDGIDKIGCFTVRVYYDWFLVPGSCKCWKKTSQGSLDALKKIFIGK